MLDSQTLTDQLGQLVSMKTLPGDTETNTHALDFIQSCTHPQTHVRRMQNGAAEILILSNTPLLSPDIGYLVHVDVVAGSDALFTMQQKDQLVYGRGVSDMKFSIPLGIALLHELIEKNSSLTFSVAITTDEEVGGFEGAAFLAHKLKWRPKTLIVPDGGDDLKFVRAAKGVAQFRVTTFGKSAHASRVWHGENAIPKMARIIDQIEKRYHRNNAHESWKTTVNFGTIHGGISINQVCDQVSLQIDFRYPETENFDRIAEELHHMVHSIAPESIIEMISVGCATATDTTLPIVQRFLQAFTTAFDQEVTIEPNFGSSDARHFAPYALPILMIKPKGGDIHMESEWLDVDSTMQFYQALRLFVLGEEKK